MASETTKKPKTPKPQQREGLKETIDSTVVAFILAFVFRAFVIEAFVIPTGSMAATLNGAHGTMICTNCGWEFDYGLTDPASGATRRVDERAIARCQNCRFPNFTSETNDAKRNQEKGDRILVFKWPFDIGGPLLGPRRWDITVFKDPNDQNPRDGTTNYIKRLAGLPNEVLQIIDGDVYVCGVDEVSDSARTTLDAVRHLKYLQRSDTGRAAIAKVSQDVARAMPAVLSELDTKLRVQRKSRVAQRALWTVVYDHDYPPRERGESQPIWRPLDTDSAWTVLDRRLRFDGTGAAESAVQLTGPIDNFLAYNVVLQRPFINPLGTPVSDLKIQFVLDYQGGSGALRVRLVKRDDVFVGELRADGTVSILHASTKNPSDLQAIAATTVNKLKPGHKTEFAMRNVDYRVSVAINGKEILATTDADYAPDLAMLRATPIPKSVGPAILAADLDVELTHVAVLRDGYYLSAVRQGQGVYRGQIGWGTQNNPILLRAGEYFMLGDNSAQSKDSRLWSKPGPHLLAREESCQVGTVPKDQMIGRAFFVYWPSGLRTTLVPFLRDVGWIPNFGKMRWIR